MGRARCSCRDGAGGVSVVLKGEQLGPYRVLRRLGIGGMAEVYEALEPSGRAVALKVMRPDVRRASSVAMFVQEARIAQELDHEHIVRVESYGEIDGEHYMVMELVDGWTLEEAIELHRHAGERFSLGAAVDCAVQICRALSCVHELDPPIVHRDVTPHNVFVTTEGVVKLSDFGIAKQHGGPSLTVTGQIKGKLAYLAPEQATGEPLTARSDLYLVGLVLFELSTGERYVQTKDAVEAIMAAQRPTWRAPSSLRAEARVLDGILRRVLQRQPTLRFASARKLGDTLARLLVHLDGRAEDLVAHLRQLDASLPDGMAGSFEAAPTSVEPSVTSIDPYASSAIEAASAPHLEALATRPSAPTVLHESDSLVALGHDDQSRVRGGIETRFSARELQTVPRARAAAPRRQPGSLTMQLSGMADGQASDDRQAMARTRLKVSVGVLALGLVVLAVGVGLYIGSSGSGAGGGAGERRGLGSAAATAAGDGAVGRRSRPRAVSGALADAAQLDGTGRSADPAPIHDSDSDGGGRGTGVAGVA
ncbi:MAG: serine/threonine protein kinase, partial [Myxococcales bacterium]|nr:serine/threonine protein kinase [Myxococcales bacterium]